MKTHDTPEHDYNLERLIFLSDGVFAIVITLLALELRPPAEWDRTFAGLLNGTGPALLAFAISFAAVGGFWNAHRLIFARIRQFAPPLVPLNLLLLGFVVLLPFAARLIFEGGLIGQPFLIYIGVIAAIATSQSLLWGYAWRAHIIDPRYGGRVGAMILVTQLAIPLLIALAGLLLGQGAHPAAILPIFLLVAGLGVQRRRMLARVAPSPEPAS